MSEPWLSTHIERWPTAKLVPYARNARTHSEDQVAQIAASIVEFGFTNPILAGSDGVIVAGHGRLAAAQKLGLDTVPVVVLDHLTPTQRRALIIADNRIAENAGWDDAMLRIELQSLQEDGFNLDITGFDADALAEIMAGEETTVDGQTDDDAVPEVSATPISRPGDVWELGNHRLVCGDATDPKSYELLMADAKADMVFTDPPYNVDYANSAKDKMRGKDRPILNDNLGDGFYDFLLAALTPMLERCAGASYIAMSSSELDTLQQAFRAAGGKWSTFIIWAKNTFRHVGGGHRRLRVCVRAYARHRGVSHVAVKKAIDTGRISQLPDGTIDPVVADAQWAANTTPTRRSVTDVASDKPAPKVSAAVREIPQAAARPQRETPEPPTPALSSGGTSLLQARTVNEVVKAQTNKVRLARLKGELVDRSQAVAHVFKLARAERDAWLNWPARISSQMAAGLGVDAHVLHVALDAAVRQQLQDLGDVQPKVD